MAIVPILAIAIAIVLFPMGEAAAAGVTLRTKPNIFYQIISGANGGDIKFSTAGAAYSYAQSALPPGPHGMIWTGMEPSSSAGTLNGEPAVWFGRYKWQYMANPGNPWNDGSVTIAANYECGSGMQTEAKSVPGGQLFACLQDVRAKPDCPKSCPSGGPKYSAPKLGDPILPSTGILLEDETDYADSGFDDLSFTRTYRSDRKFWSHNFSATAVDLASMAHVERKPCFTAFGPISKTYHCFTHTTLAQRELTYTGRDGNTIIFGNAADYPPTSGDIKDRAVPVMNGAELAGFTIYKGQSGDVEQFDRSGLLVSVTKRNGQTKTFTYSDAATDPLIAPEPGLLIQVADQAGRTLRFTYLKSPLSGVHMATMTDPLNRTTTYGYDEATAITAAGEPPAGNLTSVTHPDGSIRRYWYNEQDKTSNTNLPFAMTGITDENGIRHATFKYDIKGLAISTEQDGGVNKYVFNYMNPLERTIVIDPLGTSKTYWFKDILGTVKHTKIDQPDPTGTQTTFQELTHDANGNVATYRDLNGNVTSHTYDLSTNLETTRIDAVGTSAARTTSTEWNASLRARTKIAEPKRLTTFSYDAMGNLQTKTVQATTDETGAQKFSASVTGAARVWTYEYNSQNQLSVLIGPRRDIADVTRYDYDNATGNLSSVTNAAGHVTAFSDYDASGKASTIRSPNGVVTRLVYNDRGLLANHTVTDGTTSHLTSFTYDKVGQLKTVTSPGDVTVTYNYDGAHRLTGISDSLGHSIQYTLDNMGNRISDSVKDAGGTLSRKTTRVYDLLNHLKQVTGAQQ